MLAAAALAALAAAPAVLAHGNCLTDFIASDQHVRHLYARESTASGKEWGYEADVGPAFWASLDPAYVSCSAGKHQSPINFEGKEMLANKPHTFKWARGANNVSFTNNGHTVQANIPAGAGFSLVPGGGTKTYTLAQFHLHSPSEHHLDERAFALEAHFVHTTPQKDIAVLGVWFELDTQGSALLDSLLAKGAPKGKGKTIGLDKLDLSEVQSAITAAGAKFYSYDGSLTTPPCSESVKWSVLAKPLKISLKQLKAIQEAIPFNSRATAPVGLTNSPSSGPSAGSSSGEGRGSSSSGSGHGEGKADSQSSSYPANPNKPILSSARSAAGPHRVLAAALALAVSFAMLV
ncbi:hypothetical protein HK105_209289 [Polyrhizophydium stewartii]|uniref:Carbonic anhydrase n=1 Tax=Polyrhizophydium stewartii TaxID=2732419 RepID=A0ABR4MVF6_9FUNG